MDYKTTIERIQAIENAMDVTSIKYKGLHLWPFVRVQLWQRLLHPDRYAPPAVIGLQRLAQKLSQGFFRPEFYTPYLEHAKRHKHNLTQLSGQGPVEVLLYSRYEDHKDTFGNSYYNAFIDPLVDLIKTRHTFLKLELITENSPRTLPRVEYTHFFDSVDYVHCDAQRSIIAAFQDSHRMPAIENGAMLTELLARTRFDLALSEDYLMMESERILHFIRYFRELLSILQPKVVFLAGYQDAKSMALISACKLLNITTVDIQRNDLPLNDGKYSHWQQAPEGGYEMLPDYFWCWGKKMAESIRATSNPEVIRPIIGGNLWMSKWVGSKAGNSMLDKPALNFVRSLKAKSKVILVTLQQNETQLPGVIAEAMQKAPSEWYWLIRLHPIQKAKIDTVKAALEELHIEQVSVEEATKLPLYLLLNHSHRHVTQGSSIAVEALQFNVPSVIINAAACRRYPNYIKKGYFTPASHAEEIINSLYAPSSCLVEDLPAMESNEIYARTALKEIMGYTKVSKSRKKPRKPAIDLTQNVTPSDRVMGTLASVKLNLNRKSGLVTSKVQDDTEEKVLA